MRKTYLAVLTGTMVALVLCVIALALVRPRFVMSVDGFDVNGTEDIAVGRGSGICVDGVPHDFLTIKRDGGSLSWTVDAKCVKDDSLCYFKINNQNPNLHPIGNPFSTVRGRDCSEEADHGSLSSSTTAPLSRMALRRLDTSLLERLGSSARCSSSKWRNTASSPMTTTSSVSGMSTIWQNLSWCLQVGAQGMSWCRITATAWLWDIQNR